MLTHWGRVTHICVGKLTINGSDNGLSPKRRQAIIWTNAGILLIGPLGTNFSEILSDIHTFSFKKMRLKMSSGKWRPFCLGLNVLMLRMLLPENEYLNINGLMQGRRNYTINTLELRLCCTNPSICSKNLHANWVNCDPGASRACQPGAWQGTQFTNISLGSKSKSSQNNYHTYIEQNIRWC